jgi:hypothetical protein
MHARHAAFVSFVFLFLLALCLVALLLPSTWFPPSFFQLPPVISSKSGTEHGSAGGNKCDYTDGRWVRDADAGVTAYYTEDCPFLDPGFRCLRNGRGDDSFQYWRWRPRRCHLPK